MALGLALSLGCSSSSPAPHDGSGGSPRGGASAGSAATVAGASGFGGAVIGGAGQGGGGSGAGAGGAPAAGSGGAGGASAGQGGNAGAGGGSGEAKSKGCGQMRTLQNGKRMVMSDGMQRTYALRVPADYDNTRPYRLILGFHGAGNSSNDVAVENDPERSYFGLLNLSEGSTIFAAPDATGGIWKPDIDIKMVEDLLTQLGDDLCIDTSRIVAEGFSHGGAMTWTLACALPGTFQAAVVHSGGGLPIPQTCQPIPFFSALGNDGSGQDMSSDFFAMTNGCTVESLPLPPRGGHVCTDYKGCSAGHPTRYCDYDGPHTPSHSDPGQSQSWVPQEVWQFLTQF